MPPTTTPRVRSRHATAQLRAARLHQGVASPEILSISFSVFSWPSGVFFFFSGLVGFPLPCFPPPCFLVLGGWVGVFCCLLRLASFFLLHLGQPGHPTRNPPGPHSPIVLARATSPISCWELSVGRAETKGCGVTGGVVTPHTV